MSHTFEAPSTKKEHRLPRKLLIEKARKDDVVLPPRTQVADWLHSEFLNGAPDLDEDGFPNYTGT